MQPGVEGVCQTWYHLPHDKCGLGRILRECPSLNFLEIPSSGFPEEHRLLTSKPTEYPPRPLSRQIHWAQANPKSGSLGSSRIILSARLCFDGLRFPGNMTCGCPTQCKPRLPLCPSASHPESNGYVFLRRFQSQFACGDFDNNIRQQTRSIRMTGITLHHLLRDPARPPYTVTRSSAQLSVLHYRPRHS